ncbi:hypothetical protein ALP91_05625 [Pseudomonas savastanoi pv. glycinea]|nr:hypothetical protein ALP91_05625 [Pseudomonas savastanoi pv. glycinea]
MQGSVGLLIGGLGQLFGLRARVGHGLIGLLTGRQHSIERVDRRGRQARLHIHPSDLDTDAHAGRLQLGQTLIDAAHQIATQPLTALGGLAVSTDQLGTGNQNGVQIPRRRQRHSAAIDQPVQCGQYMIALQYEGVGVSHFVEHGDVQLHHTGITGQQKARTRQSIAHWRRQGRDFIGFQCRWRAQQGFHPSLDHPISRGQQHYLLERLRPGGQQSCVLHPLERAEAHDHGTVLRIDLAHVGRRPGKRSQQGHAIQSDERQSARLQPWAIGRRSLRYGLVDRLAHGCVPLLPSSVGGPSTSTRNGAASVRSIRRVPGVTMVPSVSSERSRL